MQVTQLHRACGDSPAEAEVLVSADGQLHDVIGTHQGPGALMLRIAAISKPANPPPAAPRANGVGGLLVTHKVNPVNEAIDLEIMDAPGAGGAPHVYRITVWRDGVPHDTLIQFQNGPLSEAGPNGITQEVLLAIVIDRLEAFQRGPFACKDNEDAIGMIKGGLTCLKKRTLKRVEQGVEGTNEQHVETPVPSTPAQESALVAGAIAEEPLESRREDGKLLVRGRPFPLPEMQPGYAYLSVEEAKAFEVLPVETEWFDTDNGQWWSVRETIIDWSSVGGFRRAESQPDSTVTGASPQSDDTAPVVESAPAPEEPKS